MADFTRRAFLKGTAKTILTGATITAGGLSTTSTTPVKVLPAAKSVMKWKNLNVLSPKAKAYRTFLRGIKTASYVLQDKVIQEKNAKLNTKEVRTTPYQKFEGRKTILSRKMEDLRKGATKDIHLPQSPARAAFEQATLKGEANAWRRGNSLQSETVARKVHPESKPFGRYYPDQHKGKVKRLSTEIHSLARKTLAKELRKQRKIQSYLPDKEQLRVEKEIKKRKGAKVGGGGKMALPGMESAKNPTGMSLITQRFTL